MPFHSTPTNGQTHTEGSRTWQYSTAQTRWNRLPLTLAQQDVVVGNSLPTTGTINIDFAALNGTIQQISLTGNPTITTSNRAPGRSVQLVLDANGATRTPTWPGWRPFGAALPTTLASGKQWSFALRCRGTTDASIDVAAVESV
jgi:hypothetical protein